MWVKEVIKHILSIIQFCFIARMHQLTDIFLVLALFSHLLTCVRRNCPMMFSKVFNKKFESDEYSPTSEVFLITFLSFYFSDYQIFRKSKTLVSNLKTLTNQNIFIFFIRAFFGNSQFKRAIIIFFIRIFNKIYTF